MRTRTPRVERGETPFRNEKRLPGATIEFPEGIDETFGIERTPHPHHIAVKICPRIAIEGNDIAIFPSNLPYDRMGAADSRKSCTENEVIRICAADCRCCCREVSLGGKFQEVEFILYGHFAAFQIAFCKETHLCLPCRMGLRQFRDCVVKTGIEHSAPPPGKFVVDEISQKPRIILIGRTFPACDMNAPHIKIRVEHVGERSARTTFVWTYEILFRHTVTAYRLSHRKRERVKKSPVLQVRIAAAAKHVESPRLEARNGVRCPIGSVGKFAQIRFPVNAAHCSQTPLSLIAYVIHPQQRGSPAKRIDSPPLAVPMFCHPKESGRSIIHPLNKAIRRIRRNLHLNFVLWHRH